VTEDRAAALRDAMVDRLLATATLSKPVEAAFRSVPRDLFLPGVDLERVYSGDVIVTRSDDRGRPISSSSQIGIMAPMLEHLAVSAGMRVLEVGAGTGYNAALLDELVGPDGSVTTIEIDPTTAEEARVHLAGSGHRRVHVIDGDGWSGVPEAAPVDRIVLTASTADLSPAWVEQLRDGGILVAPVVLRANGVQAVVAFRKHGLVLESERVVVGGFMPLRGHGAPAESTETVGELRISAAGSADLAAIARLLAEPPRLALDDFDWSKEWLLAIVAEGTIPVSRVDQPITRGIATADGVALIQWTRGAVAGPQALLLSYGSGSALELLCALMAKLRDRSFDDVRVRAVPAGPDASSRTYVFEVTLQ